MQIISLPSRYFAVRTCGIHDCTECEHSEEKFGFWDDNMFCFNRKFIYTVAVINFRRKGKLTHICRAVLGLLLCNMSSHLLHFGYDHGSPVPIFSSAI